MLPSPPSSRRLPFSRALPRKAMGITQIRVWVDAQGALGMQQRISLWDPQRRLALAKAVIRDGAQPSGGWVTPTFPRSGIKGTTYVLLIQREVCRSGSGPSIATTPSAVIHPTEHCKERSRQNLVPTIWLSAGLEKVWWSIHLDFFHRRLGRRHGDP